MAHEFESGFFTKKEAWHKLGNLLENAPNSEEAFQKSGLNWEVYKEQLLRRIVDITGTETLQPVSQMALTRNVDHRVLGFCTDSYEIYQNHDAFKWCQPLIESGYWTYDAAGSLKKGEMCWILLKQAEVQLIPNDTLKEYLLVLWAHNGSKANIVLPTAIRVVCMNTLNYALSSNDKRATIRHSSNIKLKMEEVKDMYNLYHNMFESQRSAYVSMIDKKLTDVQVEEYIDSVFPIDLDAEGRSKTIAENKVNFVKSMAFGKASGHEMLGIRNTVYGAYMAVSESVEHYLGGNRIKDRGVNILFGNGADINQRAFNKALELVKIS